MTDPSRVRMSGALAPLAEGFRISLQAEGYTPHGAIKQLHLFAHLSRGWRRSALTWPTSTASRSRGSSATVANSGTRS